MNQPPTPCLDYPANPEKKSQAAYWLNGMTALQSCGFVLLAVSTALPLPVYDLLPMLSQYFTYGLNNASLLPLFNGHAIPLPRLLLVLEAELTGGHAASLTVLTLACWLGCTALLLRQSRNVPPSWRLVTRTALVFCLLRAFLLEAIVIPNGFNYGLLCFFAVLAIILAVAMPKPDWWHQPLAALSALAAALSLANGLLLFPLLGLLGMIRQRTWRAAIPHALVGAIAISFYFPGTIDPASRDTIDPLRMLGLLLHILGSPWIIKSSLIGYIWAGLLLGASLGLIAWLLRRLSRLDPLHYLALALLLFGLGSLCLISYARQDFGSVIGTSGRYGMLNGLLQAGLLLALPGWLQSLPAAASSRLAKAQRWRYGLLFAAVLLLAEQGAIGRVYWQMAQEARQDAIALRAGQRDPALLRHVHTQPDEAFRILDELAQRRLYGFAPR